MRSWIGAMLAVTLVVAANGAAVAADKGAIGQSLQYAVGKPEIRGIPRMTVALIRGTRPTGGCGPAWDKLVAWAKKNDLVRNDTVYAGLSYDDASTTPPEKARYDACMSVPKGTEGDGEVVIGEIAGRNYAVFLHRGPYENLSETYACIHKLWKPRTKLRVGSGPALEIYRTPAMDTPPGKLLTEVCVPLGK